MNLAGQTAVTLLRALAIALIAVAAAVPLLQFLTHLSRRQRLVAWSLLLAPYLTPALLVGYGYSKLLTSQAAFYHVVLTLKLIPVAALALYFAPPPLTPAAWHCYRLAGHSSGLFRLRGAGGGPWIAFALVFLFAFGEFEMAALWNIRTWTVALFDAHTGGLPVRDSLRLVALPAVVELGLLALIVTRLRGLRRSERSGSGRSCRYVWLYLIGAAVIVAVVPLVAVARQAVAGVPVLLENFVLTKDIAVSVVIAALAAILVYALALRPGAWVMALPGLLGALVLSLVLLGLFQLPGLRRLYDTPVPLVAGLVLLLSPFALLLRWLVRATEHGSALHLARMTGSRVLVWELSTKRKFWVVVLLFCWGYFDLTASAILAPVGMTPVFVRLHNLMHYGQSAVLSAMVLVAVAVPVVLVLIAGGTRWSWHD